MKILYITYENVYRTAILQAMVLNPMRLIAEKYNVKFTISSSIKPSENDDIYRKNKTAFLKQNIDQIEVVEFSKNLKQKQTFSRFITDIIPIVWFSIKEARKNDLIHCRSYGGAIIGMIVGFVTRTPYIFDMRGTLPEELVDLGLVKVGSLKHKLIKSTERLLIRRACVVFTVSEKFNEYIKTTFKKKNSININNPTDFSKFTVSTNPTNKVNFIYSGSMLEWHMPELTIQYFNEVQKRFPQKVYFYFCTNQKDEAEEFFVKYAIPKNSYEINTVPFHDMPLYYAKSHIAFQLTKNSFQRSVCFPVKFSEYIAAELHVIANTGIGDIEDIITTHKCGTIIKDLDNFSSNIENICKIIRQSLSEELPTYKRKELNFLDWKSEGIVKIHDAYQNIINRQLK